MSKPTTQKAKGIINGLPHFFAINPKLEDFSFATHHLIKTEADIDQHFPRKYFARPCPATPKHGFVESRLISTAEEAKDLLKEVLLEDVMGELLLGSAFDDVKYNSILTEFGALSIGPGNDGATGGKGAIQFSVAPTIISKECKNVSGIADDDAGYFEIIYTKGGEHKLTPSVVQLRGGPVVDCSSNDYIPADVVVKSVVIPSDDLLVWAKQVDSFEEGTVVWGSGHTLSSHAAVHCVLHKVPFVTTFEPIVGQTIEKSSNADQKPLATSSFTKGMAAGLTLTTTHGTSAMRERLRFSLAILHNWAYIRNSSGAAELLGAAISSLEKICASLVLGEFRHAENSPHRSYSRESLYHKAFLSKTNSYISKMKAAFDSFSKDTWKSGFGGEPWALCAFYSINLWNAAADICNSKDENISDSNIAKLIDVFNGMINLSHNNGWWFNKIADNSLLDMAAQHSGFCAAKVAPLMVDILELSKSATIKQGIKKIDIECPYFIDVKRGACSMFVNKDRLQWATFRTQTGLNRQIYLDLTVAQTAALKKKFGENGKVFLTAQKNGMFKLGNLRIKSPCKLEGLK